LTAGREVFSYTGAVLRDAVDPLTGAIAEAITQPLLRDYEVAEAKHSMEPLIEAREADAAFNVLQGVHAAAYGSSSAIGHSTYASKSDLDDIDESTLRAFLGARFTANNIVVVANSKFA
jgi:predicted Zn-dependent peptidase